MSSSSTFVVSPESEVLTFKQRGGESLKEAWDRITDLHKKIQPVLAMSVLLRCFYYGLCGWSKHALDIMVGGNFLEYDETKAINVINGLVDFFTHEDGKIDAIAKRLDKIEESLSNLKIKEEDNASHCYTPVAAIEKDWEPYIKIEIKNQMFLAHCDVGSMLSTMPKGVFDALNFDAMIEYPFHHSHANGSLIKILGRVNNVQVAIRNKTFPIDFMILEKSQANIVLGRAFLKVIGGFINLKHGFIYLNAPIGKRVLFLKKNNEELIERFDEMDNDNT